MTEHWDGQRRAGLAARLRARAPLLGTVLTVPSVSLAELVAASVDFVWIDLEHGALGAGDVQTLAIAARAGGAAAVVRLPDRDAPRLPAILDAGVDGVVAPRVETAAEAESLVERLRYPPLGRRGFAPRRAHEFGRRSAARTLAEADVACMLQIESPRGIEAVQEMAAMDGVDALVVGCADLSLALDGEVELRSAGVREAIGRVQSACAGAGIASGIAGPGDARLLAELSAGQSSVFVYSADVRMYAQAVDDGMAELRRELALRAPDEEEIDVST